MTVNVTVSKLADAAGKGADQHMLVNANKVPAGFVGGDADVHRATGKTGPTDNIMTVTSEDVVPRKDGLLECEVDFQPGKGLLTPASVGTVWRLAKQMPNPKPGTTIEIAGLTVKVEGKDDQQRKDRFDAVLDHLKQGGGMDPAAPHSSTAEPATRATSRSATARRRRSSRMSPATCSGSTTSTPARAPTRRASRPSTPSSPRRRAWRARCTPSPTASCRRAAKVRPQHYTTFLDALKFVSGMTEWDIGAKQAVRPPSGAGDFPTPAPSGDGGTAVA